MDKKQRISYEINVLRQYPAFIEYMKVLRIMEEGQAILSIISNKEKMINALSARREPYSHLKEQVQEEELDEPMLAPPRPQPRMAPPEMQRNVKQRPPVTQERERELDKKIAMADADFNANPQDLGQEDDLELPDIEE